jgi:hypothetical protein
VQLLTIGILGHYIGSLFDEVKKRPEYIVDEILQGQSTAEPFLRRLAQFKQPVISAKPQGHELAQPAGQALVEFQRNPGRATL